MKKTVIFIFTLFIVVGVVFLLLDYLKPMDVVRPTDQVVVSILNVGQGDAILIEGLEKTILVDTGPPSDRASLMNELNTRNIKKIDVLLLSHSHADHIGNAAEVIESYEVGSVIEAGFPSTSPYVKKYYLAMEKKKIPLRHNKLGDVIEVGDGAYLRFLTPIPEFDSSKNINNQSIVTKLVYGRMSVLLTGDIEKDLENRLVKYYVGTNELTSEILKSPHHGSKTSSSARFISAINSKAALISLKSKNDFGHPHDLILQRYEKHNMKVYQTNLNGTIRVLLGKSSYKISTEF